MRYVFAVLAFALSIAPHRLATAQDWAYFGGSKYFDRYSPLSQIDQRNVDDVEILWERPGVDATLLERFEDLRAPRQLRSTPIMVDGVLYAPNAIGLVEAFDAATGETLWVQQPFQPTMREVAGQGTRGVDHWRSGDERRIVSIRGEYLYAMDALTGSLLTEFGDEGRVSLNRNTPDAAPYFATSGPIIVNNVVVIGGNGGGRAGGGFGDGGPEREATPEDIRGYDVRTGRQLWTFHVLPREGEPGRESWGEGSADFVGNMGAWAPMSADENLDHVYVPLSAPTNSYYGGHRPGDNLYGNSLVVLNARSGELVWHFQMVHHDLWDYDTASPPVLGEIEVDGRRIQAVMQASKTGFLYVFDRETGEPVWPIVERPVPQSTVPGEETSPTQPFPSKPPAFDRQGITPDDLIDFTPQLKQAALDFLRDYHYGPLFTPWSVEGADGKKSTLILPSAWGSGNWNTGAFDPENGVYYAVSMTMPGAFGLIEPTNPDATLAYLPRVFDGSGQPSSFESPPPYGPGPNGLPLLKPPYGRVTALDLNHGEELWMAANGDGPRDHPLLRDLDLPPLGTVGRPAPLVTRTLLFLGESGEVASATLRAYDKTNGDVLAEIDLPAPTSSAPMTYIADGRQYVVVAISSTEYGTGWVALGLAE